MRTVLTKNTVEEIFKQKVNASISHDGDINVNRALQLIIDFFNNYEIRNVDLSIPDNDMLLFEYGIYNWQDGKGENYTIGMARQFYIEENDNGFSQLHLVLYFNTEGFEQIQPSSTWSVGFENTEQWIKHISHTEGFTQAAGKPAKAFDIFLTETD